MNVKTLQLFLQCLVHPLAGSGASGQTLDALERITRGLEPFAERPVSELAAFIERAHGYEQQGHWPQTTPSIKGEVVDAPSADDYAARLKGFLQREVPASGPMPEAVAEELEALQRTLKPDALKEVAAACGVTGKVTSAKSAIEKAFETITRRKLPDALMESIGAALLQSSGDPARIDRILAKVQAVFGVPQIKKLAGKIGVSGAIGSKQDGIDKIRAFLLPASVAVTENQLPTTSQPEEPKAAEGNVDQIVEILKALKSKADPDDASHEEVEEELKRLEEQMSKEEAVAAAKQLGVGFGVQSKSDAMKRIREKVFERKLVREKIRY